jgi:excinuclease ABC subunit C
VASMVVFTNGVSDRSEYRKFKTRTDRNDDFFNMNETITRRFGQKNLKNWGKPDLVLIDGGKGQLDAAIQARDKLGIADIPFVGLAKRDEQIVVSNHPTPLQGETLQRCETDRVLLKKQKVEELGGSVEVTLGFTLINLPKSSHVIKLFQRIRDESHRFAVSYHTSVKRQKQTTSIMDEIPGIGPKTNQKLIRKFGSIKGVANATDQELQDLVGPSKAKVVINRLKAL